MSECRKLRSLRSTTLFNISLRFFIQVKGTHVHNVPYIFVEQMTSLTVSSSMVVQHPFNKFVDNHQSIWMHLMNRLNCGCGYLQPKALNSSNQIQQGICNQNSWVFIVQFCVLYFVFVMHAKVNKFLVTCLEINVTSHHHHHPHRLHWPQMYAFVNHAFVLRKFKSIWIYSIEQCIVITADGW